MNEQKAKELDARSATFKRSASEVREQGILGWGNAFDDAERIADEYAAALRRGQEVLRRESGVDSLSLHGTAGESVDREK